MSVPYALRTNHPAEALCSGAVHPCQHRFERDGEMVVAMAILIGTEAICYECLKEIMDRNEEENLWEESERPRLWLVK
jgi:hypothetical protein